MDTFKGKWEVLSRENLDEILKAYGDDQGESANAESVALEYKQDADQWICVVTLASGNSKPFPLCFDQAIESETLDGRPIQSTISMKDGKMVEEHKDKVESLFNTSITREVNDGQLIVTTQVKDITSITKYKKVE